MRGRDAKRQRSRERIRRERALSFCYAAMFFCLLISGLSAGCVRASGMAGYWHTGSSGETQTKQVGFDTTNLVPKDKDRRNITF